VAACGRAARGREASGAGSIDEERAGVRDENEFVHVAGLGVCRIGFTLSRTTHLDYHRLTLTYDGQRKR
jgi:hypothetical protein